MSNIATGFFRLHCRGDWHQAHVSRKQLLKTLFSSQGGRSYHVPAWSRLISPQIMELQGGFKGTATMGVEHLQKRFGDRLEAIWLRDYHDDTDLPDQISYYTCSDKGEQTFSEPEYSEYCRYGCDRVELHWRPDAPHSLQEQRVFSCNVSYLAINDRTYLGRDERPRSIRTPTTPAWVKPERGFDFSSFDFLGEDVGRSAFPSNLINMRSAINQYATHVDYFWHRRLVQRRLLWRNFWMIYYADGWDNCLDPLWVLWQDEHQTKRS